MDAPSPRLPVELILHILSQYTADHHGAIYSPSQPETKTVLAFTLVCRATYSPASRYLRQHCVHIASNRRLRELLLCLALPRGVGPAAAGGTASLAHLTCLYLAPFGPSLDDQPTAMWVRELFCTVCNTLRRLVIDIPLRSLYPAEDHLDVRRTLREGFARLTRLEEFVSARDELYLNLLEPELQRDEPQVWTLWPELRRLALYNVDAGDKFWARVAAMPLLETVVLTRADCLEEGCAKTPYFAATDRALKVVLVNISSDQPQRMSRPSWATVDPEHKMKITTYDVPTSYYGDENPTMLCQERVLAAALRGTLWDWTGTRSDPRGSFV